MWTHVILLFLCGLALTSPLGVASYLAGSWFRRVTPKWAKIVDGVLAVLGLIVFTTSLLFIGPLCFGGALAARYNEGHSRTVFSYFVRMLSSTALATLSVYFVWATLAFVFPTTYNPISTAFNSYFSAMTSSEFFGFLGGAWLGLTASPTAIPIGVWVWKSSKLRPGLDISTAPSR